MTHSTGTLNNSPQIVLPLVFDRQFSFDNFFSDQRDFISANLKSLITDDQESLIGLYGGHDSGKTHLLNACAHFARGKSVAFQLYDAALLLPCDPAHFDDLAGGHVIAIDDLDVLSGRQNWEACIYRIINRCKAGELKLIFSLSRHPKFLQSSLADFHSRLSWGLLLDLKLPAEVDIGNLLQHRARLLGIHLSKEVMAYLFRHYPRRLSTQIEILRILDTASLSAQKKISVSFIRQVLSDISFQEFVGSRES